MHEPELPSFEDVASELSGPLCGYLTRMVGSPACADDLLQETLMRIARGLPSFDGRSSVKTWAYRIAANIAYDHLRKSQRAQFVEFDENDAHSDEDEGDRLVLGEMNSCVREVVDRLPPDYRSVVVLYNIQGKSLAETAEICEISLAAAKIRIHRAKERLKEALNRECTFYRTAEGTLRCDRRVPFDR
jgi:RNA polymerase sigma-70 factor (ECF subfamily)